MSASKNDLFAQIGDEDFMEPCIWSMALLPPTAAGRYDMMNGLPR
jgi:hypothetical protein